MLGQDGEEPELERRERDLVWGDASTNARESVKLYVGYVRRKLGLRPDGGSPIETVRGFGYRYRACR